MSGIRNYLLSPVDTTTEDRALRPLEHSAPSWSTENLAPRMSRITSLTCDTEVGRISSAVTAEIDWETDEEIGPVFALEDVVETASSLQTSIVDHPMVYICHY